MSVIFSKFGNCCHVRLLSLPVSHWKHQRNSQKLQVTQVFTRSSQQRAVPRAVSKKRWNYSSLEKSRNPFKHIHTISHWVALWSSRSYNWSLKRKMDLIDFKICPGCASWQPAWGTDCRLIVESLLEWGAPLKLDLVSYSKLLGLQSRSGSVGLHRGNLASQVLKRQPPSSELLSQLKLFKNQMSSRNLWTAHDFPCRVQSFQRFHDNSTVKKHQVKSQWLLPTGRRTPCDYSISTGDAKTETIEEASRT